MTAIRIFCIIILTVTILLTQQATAQTRLITGTVLDSLTRAPIPNASISLKGSGKGALTNAEGKFHLTLEKKQQDIRLSASGYNPQSIHLTDSTVSPLTILLSVSYTSLQQFVLNKKKKYRNKNNPAVELIRQVIDHKDINAPAAYPYASFDQYDKIRVLADRPPKMLVNSKLFKKYNFLFNPPDTTLVPGKALTPAYLEETSSRMYTSANPKKTKQVILGHKQVNLGEYIDMTGLSAIMDKLYEDFSVYDNTMLVFTLQFMSPVAKLGPQLYEYFIRDTVVENGYPLVHLSFNPRNSQDLLFKGDLYIILDGSYAIRKAEMEISNHSNLNWVRSVRITQTFEKGPGNRYYRSLSDMFSYFSFARNNLGFYGDRSVSVSSLSDSVLPEAAFRGLPVDTALLSVPRPDSFWTTARPTPLSASESLTYYNTDSLVKMKAYRNLMDIVTLLTAGYKSAGKFDIGPVGNFYSFNSLEGSRFQFGGRSNAKLSTRLFTNDYIAYGAGDKKWKYYVSGTYSINHKSIYTYPFHYIQASFLHDVRNPGQETQFAQDNAFLSSFNRGIGGKWLYTDIANLSYIHELGDHFSYSLGLKYWLQKPVQSLHYIYEPSPDQFDTISSLTTSQLSTTLTWAPHEQMYQGRVSRQVIVNKYPIFTFQYAAGIKGMLGGQFNYNAFHFSVFKRWYLAPVGFSDISFDAGYITGNLPFPLLVIHPANTSYFYSYGAYNLMNTEEFVSDHYATVNIDHYFNGFFLNKIPLLKKLRLREVVEGKLLYGGVRPENNPALNPQQMKFPLNDQGAPGTFSLGNQPYLEAGVGIYNILNVFRIDFIRRFTYLNNPGISTNGIRLSSSLNF